MHATAPVVAPFSMLVPVVGMTAAWVLLGKTVSPVLVVGGVLLGSVTLNRAARRSEPLPEPAAI